MRLHTAKNPFLPLAIGIGVVVLAGGSSWASHEIWPATATAAPVKAVVPFDPTLYGYCVNIYFHPGDPLNVSNVVLYAPPTPKAGQFPSCPSGNYASLAPTNGEAQGGS